MKEDIVSTLLDEADHLEESVQRWYAGGVDGDAMSYTVTLYRRAAAEIIKLRRESKNVSNT